MPAPTRRERLLLTLPFYLLFLAQLIHHEVWRDEINAWAISYISNSIPELLHRIHYEAHPALWYLILYAASRFSHSIWMLKLVEAVIATGIYFILAWAAPFRRIELLLILASYYLVFEYTVKARMYGLEVLFAFAYVWFRTRRPDWVLRNVAWLGLIANVDVTSAILAGGLLLEYGLSRLRGPKSTGAAKARELASMTAVFGGLLTISLVTLWPAKDIAWSGIGRPFSHFWDSAHLVQAALKWIAVAFLPEAINMVEEWVSSGWTYFFLAPAILLALYVIFRPHWRKGLMVGAVIATGILFSQITSIGAVRHTGIVYLAFVLALWMLRAENARISPLAYALLGLTAITGVIAVIDQWSWPYTDAGAAASWIEQHHLQDLPMFDSPDTDALGVPERLHRPVYQLACNCEDRVLTFARRRDGYDEHRDVASRLIRGFQTLKISTGLLLITRPLTFDERKQLAQGGLGEQRIGQFDRGFLGDEYIYIYRVTVTPPAAALAALK